MRTQPKWIPVALISVGLAAVCVSGLWQILGDARTTGDAGATAAAAALVAFPFIYLVWAMVRDCKTAFSFDGVARPALLGPRLHRWSELRQIRSHRNLVDFIFTRGRFRVNLYLFRNSADIVEFVRARVSPTLIRPIRHDWIRASGQGWKLWVFYVLMTVAILSFALFARVVESGQRSLVLLATTFVAVTTAALLWLLIGLCCPWCGYRAALHVVRRADARNWLFTVQALEECPRCARRLTRAGPREC